jgi:mono/diheme cytochrome c family protein
MWRARSTVAALVVTLAATAAEAPGTEIAPRLQAIGYRDGHARPRALAYSAADGLLYAALSTADALAVVDPAPASGPRVVARVPVCRFPAALAPLPDGGVVVACRFEPGLRRVRRERGAFRVSAVDAGPESGARGLALAPGGAVAYVASPALRGVVVVPLATGGVAEVVPTGISPRALLVVPGGVLPGRPDPLLLASSFVDHTVTVFPIAAGGKLGPAVQTIRTDAPVLDMILMGTVGGFPNPPALAPAGEARLPGVLMGTLGGFPSPPALAPAGEARLRSTRPAYQLGLALLTHEDRPLSRPNGPVEGLDSGVLWLAAAADHAGPPFADPGPGQRAFVNLSERAPEAVVELAAVARDPSSGAVALVGAGSDNLLVTAPSALGAAGPAAGVTASVGANPTAVAALPGGRWVTADRLSDTLTFVGPGGERLVTLAVGPAERASPAERGEVLFYSRALVPNNVADGPLSLYTCAACHDDGHVDGRRHPSKRNRFYSMTKTCRGLGTTAPYLSLGEPDTIEAFADNIVATHAQGAAADPEHYDKYPVRMRLRAGSQWREVVLSPAEVRAALAAYMARIPPEPSPFVEPGRRALDAEEHRGLALFRDGCAGCHQLVTSTPGGRAIPAAALDRRLLAGQVALTSPRLYDVGTPVLGKDGNNPPSLRGVWDAAPYFSDGSARTLDEVLARTDPDAPHVHAPANAARPAYSPGDRSALLAFLRAL